MSLLKYTTEISKPNDSKDKEEINSQQTTDIESKQESAKQSEGQFVDENPIEASSEINAEKILDNNEDFTEVSEPVTPLLTSANRFLGNARQLLSVYFYFGEYSYVL